MARAFLYTGTALLLMIAVLIAANYAYLAKHSEESSSIMNLEIDALSSLSLDLNNLLGADMDNVMADAMSDATFKAINSTSTGLGLPSFCNAIDPTKSTTFNISKWILNYTNITLSQVNKSFPQVDINFSVSLTFKAFDICKATTGAISINYSANISFSLIAMQPPYFKMTRTMLRNKTLEIKLIDDTDPNIYEIIITDETKRIDFDKLVSCREGTGLCAESN